MDRAPGQNHVELLGTVCEAPRLSHCLLGEQFYAMRLCVRRQSLVDDLLPVMFPARIGGIPLAEGDRVRIVGQLRSYNKFVEGKNRLLLSVFARELAPEALPQIDVNRILLAGNVCKKPTYRTTPFSREISDLLIAARRTFRKSDYLPCIAWGRNARYAAQLEVGNLVEITGRVQSREYQKQEDWGVITRTAYEVSAATLARVEKP